MKRYLFIIAALAIMALPACENNIDADLENMEGVLCLNAYLLADADTNFVNVSRTSRENPVPVRDAVVKLYVNDNLVETVTDCYSVTYGGIYTYEKYDDELGWIDVEEERINTDTVWGIYLLKSKFNPGDNVRVDVTSGGQHVWAEDIAPRKIENITVTHTYTHVPNNQRGALRTDKDKVTLDISFDDVSADADFYRLSIFSDFYGETVRFSWLNPDGCEAQTKAEFVDYAKRILDNPIFKNETDSSVDVYYLERHKFHHRVQYDDYGYRRCPILSEGESQSSKDDDEESFDLLTSDVKNTYRVFSDHLFSNSTARLDVTDWAPDDVPDNINHMNEDDLTDEEKELQGEYYNWFLTVKLQSISEQQYYYLRAMNAIKSSVYDEMSSLSGAMKVPSNVHGGSGNFSVATQTTVVVPILKNYKPPYY